MVDLRTDPDPPELSIRLFGEVVATLRGGLGVRLPSRRSGWLLAMLAMRNGRPIERQVLAGILWPDSSDACGLQNLRQALVFLRKSLGALGQAIRTVRPRSLLLEPSPAIYVDVLDFDSAIQNGTMECLERAAGLYAGPLLDGWDEPFAIEQRDVRLRSYIEALQRLGSHYASLEDNTRAIKYLRLAAAADPYREPVFRSLMNCLARAGEGAAALETYRSLRRRLRSDLHAEPDSQTVQLYRSIRGLASNPPSKGRATSIPTPLTTLHGRGNEIREIRALLERCRLVTLTGSAGVGKTRLAIAVADLLRNSFLDGIRFVDLAPVQDPSTIVPTIASVLEIQERPGHSLLETLVAKISDLEMMILLDNCEHLTEAVSEIVEALVAGSPGLHILATSRHSIGVVGEFVWRVPSLRTPDAGPPRIEASPSRRESLLEADSVRLFLERSRCDMDRNGGPSLADLETIGSICRRLDGIPLAIELAASRMNVLSASQIESRLKDRFSILARSNVAQTRHSTMWAAIQWSWDMLPEAERSLAMALSVFRGGCSLEAIEAVLPPGLGGQLALDLVASLVDRSLLNAKNQPGNEHFVMLESIRQFAEERLRERGELDLAMDRHRDYFLVWAEEGASALNGPREKEWFNQLENEHDNLRAALDHCHRQRNLDKALRLSLKLARFWDTHGHLNEGRLRLEEALDLASGVPVTPFIAGALTHAGWMATMQGDCIPARDYFERALEFIREEGNALSTAKVLMGLGGAMAYSGDYPGAQSKFEEALTIYRELDRPIGVATALSNLGEVALYKGETEAAINYEQSVATHQAVGGAHFEALGQSLCNLSLAVFRRGDYSKARDLVCSSLRCFGDGEVVVATPGALNMLAVVCAHYHEWYRAARLLGAAEGLANSQGLPTTILLDRELATATAGARVALGTPRFDSVFDFGRHMTVGEALAAAFNPG